MKIQSIGYAQYNTPKYNQNFTGFNINALTEKLPNAKVCKNMTQLDRTLLYSYIMARPYRMGITAEEINKINKLDGNDFIFGAYELLTNKLGFSINTRPAIAFCPLQADAFAAYSDFTNIIMVDTSKFQSLPKAKMFALIRHELQHFMQNAMVLRHEEFGPLTIENKVAKNVAMERELIPQILANYPEDQLKTLCELQKNADPNLFEKYMKIKQYIKEGNQEGIDKIYEGFAENYRKQLINFRNNIINEQGVIKKDSPLTPNIKEYYESFIDTNYYNPDMNIDNIKYLQSKIEEDAINAQNMAEAEYEPGKCYMSVAKNSYYESINNPEIIKILEDIANTQKA